MTDGTGQAASGAGAGQARSRAAAGMKALHRWYSRSTGLWDTGGWWNAANALTTVVHYTQRTGDDSYAGVIGTTFAAAQRAHPGFINNYYDDNAWWALAWVAAYDLTGDRRYLEAADAIFAQMAGGWDDVCGGGIWWTTDRTYKNAIPNELFLLLAARLHQRAGGPGRDYLGWASREREWFLASGMIGPSGLVNDGLTAQCQNNAGTTWTYNQGVILGALAALNEITGDTGYLDHGQRIADAVLREMTVPAAGAAGEGAPGILAEPCERSGPRCNSDQAQFKGIFVRNLYDFYLRRQRPAYREFILANAESIWANTKNWRHRFGLRWTGPHDGADAIRQSSALDVLTAAVALTSQGRD